MTAFPLSQPEFTDIESKETLRRIIFFIQIHDRSIAFGVNSLFMTGPSWSSAESLNFFSWKGGWPTTFIETYSLSMEKRYTLLQ
jgi:hypothetical protein